MGAEKSNDEKPADEKSSSTPSEQVKNYGEKMRAKLRKRGGGGFRRRSVKKK